MKSDRETAALLVDAHVHIYDCFEIEEVLDAALRNFTFAATKAGINRGFSGVLLLTETSRENWFRQVSLPAQLDHWLIEETPDKITLLAKRQTDDGESKIYIIAGRQIVTAEGLELLALATNCEFTDGLPVASVLQSVREQDAIPVLPWAVGKWLGTRGKVLSALLTAEAKNELCLGDNSGRPIFWRNPVHFRQAKASGKHILPGTDPLPLPGEQERVGRFGFIVQGSLSDEHASTDLKQLLRNEEVAISAYGALESVPAFISNQVRLRIA